MWKKVALGFVLAAAVLAAWLVLGNRRHDNAPSEASRARPAVPVPTARHDDEPRAPRGSAPRWSLDVDPEGPLRLEGQVIGESGNGIGSADVWIASVPPRSTKTEADGSFAFDKLVGRTYSVFARSNDLIGGPKSYKLTEHSEPLVLQLTRGASIDVHVTDEAHAPIAGADVKVAGVSERVAKTDDHGDARLTGITPGWAEVEANASGYARSMKYTSLGAAGANGHLELTLRRGVAVSGHVVDEAGKPLAKVHVTAESSTGFGRHTADSDAQTTDNAGQFTFAAVTPGRHTISAEDGEHAPATSTPITVQADHPVTGIVVTMKAGGAIAGMVVDTAGKPAAFATVRIAGKRALGSTARQATTDRAGKFEMRGLTRGKLQARAESDTSASAITDVDLTAKGEVRDLKLVLDVDGTIRGTVVDEVGQAVAEAQVNAFPDLLAGEAPQAVALAGMSSATTDGAGGFVVRGLPPGSYRLWADRAGRSITNAWGTQSASAKVGDDNVRIVLAGTGSLTGKLALVSGAAPTAAFVMLGGQAAVPANGTDGTFRIDDVTAGPYDLRIYGPEFSELIRHDIHVEVGKTTDLGTILLVRGRQLVGTVVDPSNNPAPGATVKLGQMLFGADQPSDSTQSFEDMMGVRTAVTDQNGQFAVTGVPTQPTTVFASQPDLGQSVGMPIPAGTDDPPPITIPLRGFGAINGKVMMQGQPQANVSVSDASQGGGAQATFVRTASDGTFALTKTPEGTHVLSAMLPSMMSVKSTSQTVQVTAGQTTNVTIDFPVGTVTLTVNVTAIPNNEVDAAQVFLLQGTVVLHQSKELLDGFFQGSMQGMKFWFGAGKPAPAFDQLMPNSYSVCAIPITGNLMDPTFQQRLQENMQSLAVYCSQVTLNASPAAQSTTIALPAMTPLPTPGS